MKAFVKIVSMLLVLLTVLSLCACTKKEEPEKNEWVSASVSREGAISDTGYYYLNNRNLLHYVDFESGTNVCLCSKAGCTHDGDGCEAEIPGNLGVLSTMFFWNGGIYFTSIDEYGRGLYRRNADGTGQSKVVTLCEKYMKEDSEIDVNALGFTVAGNYVYYYTEIRAVVKEGNVGTYQTVLGALLRVDLRTGKEEVVVENRDYQKNKRLSPIAVRNDSAIYAVTSYPDVEYGAENYDELLNQSPVQVLQWSAETGESKVLLEKTRKELGSTITCYGGNLYCRPDDNQYSIDLETGTLKKVVENGSLYEFNADFALLFDDTNGKRPIKNLKTGELLPNEYEGYWLQVKGYTDDMLILTYIVEYEDRSKDEYFTFISVESLADGLQKEDAAEFYVRHMTSYN